MSLRGKSTGRESRPFYLVQRLRESPYKAHAEAFPSAKVKSNPFGYGRMGDYELDYMGAAEFEFGTIPEANNRLSKAGKDLVLGEFNYGGHVFDVLYIGSEGDPFEEFCDWAEGRSRDEYTGKVYDEQPFYGKEIPYELRDRLDGKEPPSYNDGKWQTALYWALRGNVIFGFQEDGHMQKWLVSMGTAPTEFIR